MQGGGGLTPLDVEYMHIIIYQLAPTSVATKGVGLSWRVNVCSIEVRCVAHICIIQSKKHTLGKELIR